MRKREESKLLIRNSSLSSFIRCPKLFYLQYVEGWKEREKPEALAIGEAVHLGLEKWTLSGKEEEAVQEAFALVSEELQDTVFALLSGYFSQYASDALKAVSSETEIRVPLSPDVDYGTRIDGLGEWEGKFVVVERKTSGLAPATFWKRYEFDRQVLGEVWAAREKFGKALDTVIVDAMFKPNHRNPEVAFKRRFFTFTVEELAKWKEETLQLTLSLERAKEEGSWPRSGECFKYNRWCSFYDWCKLGGREGVLEVTHVRERERDEKEK